MYQGGLVLKVLQARRGDDYDKLILATPELLQTFLDLVFLQCTEYMQLVGSYIHGTKPAESRLGWISIRPAIPYSPEMHYNRHKSYCSVYVE